MKIKVCGMRNAGNIKAVSELKPDYMGFIFYPKSSRFVGDDLDAAALKALPSTISKIGVFVNPTHEEVIQKTMRFKLHAIQLHGNESPAFCKRLSLYVPVIKAFGVSEDFDFGALNEYESCCSHYLFDTKTPGYGGSGEAFNWELLMHYHGSKPFFLSGGIGFGHVSKLKMMERELPALYAIDLNSKFETSPGVKDGVKLKRVMTGLRDV